MAGYNKEGSGFNIRNFEDLMMLGRTEPLPIPEPKRDDEVEVNMPSYDRTKFTRFYRVPGQPNMRFVGIFPLEKE
jgi:hypothetical protein